MNEAIMENYLNNIQGVEPEYLTEGLREFFAKFDKQVLKRTADKLHTAFTRGDGETFDEVAKKTAKLGKMPKYQEVKEFMGKFQEENTAIKQSVELSKKVLRNTFKIRDKAKLEVLANALGMTAWIKTKGGRTNVETATKETLKKVHSDVMNIYDSGFENMAADTPEEEEMKKKMMEQAKKQEKIEMVVVLITISVLSAAIVFAGITIFNFITGPAGIIMAILAILMFMGKALLWTIGIAAPVALAAIGYMKARG